VSCSSQKRAAGSRVFQTELGFPFSIVSRVSSSKGAAAIRVSLLWISRSASPVPFGEISLGLAVYSTEGTASHHPVPSFRAAVVLLGRAAGPVPWVRLLLR
jgi:hypothetical protein